VSPPRPPPAADVLASGDSGRMIGDMPSLPALSRNLPGCVVAALALLSGCQSTPTVELPGVPPALQLLESQPLRVADDCVASGSYFVGFTVLEDGRTGRIEAPSAPVCVQQALTTWVSSFRYAPPAAEIPFGVEWMLVTARRGS
jgi:hypothetical protein